jgi:hypothetical protein
MSNRHRLRGPTPPQAAITQWAASLDGAEISGGCDTCDAHQTVHVIDRGVTNIRVHHDQWCPSYQRMVTR